MDNLKRAKNFDGVMFTLTAIEFDKLLYQFNQFLIFGKIEFSDEYINLVSKVFDVLTTKSYFDEDACEVHCMLGYFELTIFMDVILEWLPQMQDEELNFEKCLADPNKKRWVTKR